MEAKPAEKEKACILRKEGYSLNEISVSLGISKSSASIWLRDIELSKTAQNRVLKKRIKARLKSAETHRARTTRNLKEASIFANNILSRISNDKDHARFASALLYWCEGEKSKNDKSLIFTNSDPLLIKTFVSLLRKGFEIDESKFRVCVHLHSYHDAKKQLLFWSQITTIPITQFIKPYRKLNSGKNKRDGYAGCASVRYHDVRIARQIIAIARAFLNK